jgi:hypothetical protein
MRQIAQVGLGIAALALAAPAHADVPGIAPFVGGWSGGHSGGLNIGSDGTGRWTYSDTRTCPNAPLAGCGVTGTTDFTLTSVANGTASGAVTASTDPTDGAAVGSPVSITLGSAGGTGTVLAVTMGKMRGWSFCNQTSPHWCAGG